MAASYFRGLTGHPGLIAFDMGGTTAKVCVIEGGEPSRAGQFEVGHTNRFVRGSGLPIRAPVLEMVEIGAGGSIPLFQACSGAGVQSPASPGARQLLDQRRQDSRDTLGIEPPTDPPYVEPTRGGAEHAGHRGSASADPGPSSTATGVSKSRKAGVDRR